MTFKKKKNKITFGIATSITIITLVVMVLSTILARLGIQAEKTVFNNGSLMVTFASIKSFISTNGIRYLFSNVVLNFRMLEPLALVIISIIAFSIMETSGLMQMCFSPLKKLNSKFFTMIILLVSFVSTFFGEYSLAIMLPFVGCLYNTLGKNGALGVLTSFLGITLGYGSGLLFNFDQVTLGILTQAAATLDVDKTYVFNNLSTSIIMTASLIIFVPVISLLIENYITPYFNKNITINEQKNVSKKGLFYSSITFIILLLIFIYMIVPGLPKSGLLLDMEQETYFDKLFGINAPFKDGISFVFLLLIAIPSFVYGKISKNLESSIGITDSLSVSLNDCGSILMIMFLGSIMISVFEWTGIGDFIVCNVVEILSQFQLSGILLILIFFILIIIVTIFVPSTLTKWSLISPVIVPLFMRANITPDFTQFIFQVADGVGKSISVFFPYFLILLGLMQKYNYNDEKVSIGGVIKRIMPVVLISTAFWIAFLVIWYLAGFPVGIAEYATL